MHKKFYSSHFFLNKSNILTFSNSRINAKYEEIFRVGDLEADFQQV